MEATLGEWGASPALRTAGLCHATYGTDGFGTALLGETERPFLCALIGAETERLVYVYGCCDRKVVYPKLGVASQVEFRDRFINRSELVSDLELRSFLELTVANELDVLTHNQELTEAHGPALLRLFERVRALLSPAANEAVDRFFG